VAFWLYLVENGINVVLAVALVHPLGVKGLALSLSIAYSVAAVAGIVVLRRWLGDLGGARTWAPLRRVAVATVVMGAVVLVVSNLSGAERGLGLLVRVVASVVAGGLVYWVAISLLGGREHQRGPRPSSRRRTGDRRPVASSRGPLPSPDRPASPDRAVRPVRPDRSGTEPPARRTSRGHVRPIPRPPAGPPPAPEGGRAG
jgi:hypothetical protein